MRRAGRWLERVALFTLLATALAEIGLERPTLSARYEITPASDAAAAQAVQQSTVEAFALGCDLALRQGTAVMVAPDRVLTNAHVVGAFRSVDIAADGQPVIASSSVEVSQLADLAIVQAGGLAAKPLPLAPYDPVPGEPVWLAGFPHASASSSSREGLVVMGGRVVDYLRGAPLSQMGQVMRIDVAARPGMSGGPVLDQAGRLAGVLFAVQSPTNDTLAIPVSVLRHALGASRGGVTRNCATEASLSSAAASGGGT